MKNLIQFLSIGFLALGMGEAFGATIEGSDSVAPFGFMVEAQQPVYKSKPTVKIALLLDTSNSMDGLINQAKAQLWDVVNKFGYVKCGNDTRPQLQIAIYEYGNDNLSSYEGYIRQVIGFSSDLDEISEKLFSLTTNGGEEYCGQVIQTSLNQLDWGKNEDDLKLIFIAGNEPFSQGRLNYWDAATNAKEKDIVVNTIFCGNYEQGISTKWKHGAILTGGEYMAIDHNRKVVHIVTPYDDVILQLNVRLNRTYISYGAMGATKIAMQSTQDQNAEAMEEAVMVKRAVSKSSRLYSNSEWDLVDASKKIDFDVSKVEKEQLPQELKNKSDKEITQYINSKKEEREKIQNEIQELNSKREAYLAKNQKDSSKGELENALLSAIQKQALKKNYTWE
ncbi:von Willebrand factor type A [Sediminicola sp. YIK13]|uniref:vWA domain-containing protein n=1 Tax=Sediminicola sp. YIK13 TaxID=1453352 RepID=UPI000722D3ED|nr:vWA domain-containing protein [Sediminicola sp. YIK13]ALM08933.1 von Willebrand factor type A [Sediminicola sp. YIK13]